MTDAELLIDIANHVMQPHDRLLLSKDNLPHACDVVALAIRLRRKPNLALRAMIEEWDRARIVRELY